MKNEMKLGDNIFGKLIALNNRYIVIHGQLNTSTADRTYIVSMHPCIMEEVRKKEFKIDCTLNLVRYAHDGYRVLTL
jgi:hypothetical protein